MDVKTQPCHEPVPNEGQNICTRVRGHEGEHRCKAGDVDDRERGAGEYRKPMTRAEFRVVQSELGSVAANMAQIADKLRSGDVRGARVRLGRAMEVVQRVEREQANHAGFLCDPGDPL